MEEKIYHKIEAYLSGTMSDKDILEFEATLQNDTILKEEVELYKAINFHLTEVEDDQEVFTESPYKRTLGNFVGSEEGRALDIQLKSIGEHYHLSEEKKNKKRSNRSRLTYLLVSSAAVFVFVLIVLTNKQTAESDLFASYYNPDDLPSFVTRGDGNSPLAEATANFNASKWEEALKDFNRYIKEEEEFNPLVFIYTGLIQMEQGNLKEAIQQFELLENADTIDTSKALWYKTLTYLKFNKRAEAKIILAKILKNSANYKFKEAQKLLKDI